MVPRHPESWVWNSVPRINSRDAFKSVYGEKEVVLSWSTGEVEREVQKPTHLGGLRGNVWGWTIYQPRSASMHLADEVVIIALAPWVTLRNVRDNTQTMFRILRLCWWKYKMPLWENSLALLQHVQELPSAWAIHCQVRQITERMETMSTRTLAQTFIPALFTIAKKCKQP